MNMYILLSIYIVDLPSENQSFFHIYIASIRGRSEVIQTEINDG